MQIFEHFFCNGIVFVGEFIGGGFRKKELKNENDMKQRFFLLCGAAMMACAMMAGSVTINKNNCTVTKDGKTYKLYGKWKVVENFEDIKIKIVDNFEDVDIKFVDNFENTCGKVKLVDNFEDVKVKIVDNFEDIKIKVVDNFEGVKK